MGRTLTVRRLAVAVAAVMFAGLHVAGASDHPDPDGVRREATYDHWVVLKDQAIPVTDGTITYADVFLPSHDGVEPAKGPWPTILMITPYNKDGGLDTARPFFTGRGYAYVLAETRGTGSSEGMWDFATTLERHDGYLQVEWAADQAWSTGSVGMIGDSYRGMNQWWTAMEQPPSLKAIVPINAPADLYRTGGVNGGQMSSLVAAQSLVAVQGLQPGQKAAEDPQAGLQVAATRPLAIAKGIAGTADIATGGAQSYDNPYYWERSPYWNIDQVKVPTMVVGGWYDIAQRDTSLMFEQLHERGRQVRMVVGNWHHANYGSGLPDAEAGLAYSLDELALRWFDYWVRDGGDGDPSLIDFGPVVYQEQNSGRWRTASQWPPADSGYEPLYLTAPAEPGASGSLQPDPPSTSSSSSLLPWHPASGACSRSAQQALIGLPPDTPCTEDGSVNDLTGLVFDLEPSDDARRLAGPISARLFVSTTGTDAFLDVRLETVSPDGTVNALTDGIGTLSFRDLLWDHTTMSGATVSRPFVDYTESARRPVGSGEIHELWIEVFPTAAEVPAGHTLRVTVQPSDAAQSVMVADRAAGMAGSVMSIHHDADHPSAVHVPFVD